MTNQPREFWIRSENLIWQCYTSEMPNSIHVIEEGPALEKIKRLELALQKCKNQRDIEARNSNERIGDTYNYAEEYNAELESILEGK